MIKLVALVFGIIHAQLVCIVLPVLKVNLVYHLLQLDRQMPRLFALQVHSDLKLWQDQLLIVAHAQLVILALKCVLSLQFVHLAITVLKPPQLCCLVLQVLLALATALQQVLIAVPASEVVTVFKLLKQQLVAFVIKCTTVLRSQILQLHNIVTWVQQLTLQERYSQSVINALLEVTVVLVLNSHYHAPQENTIQISAVRPQLIAQVAQPVNIVMVSPVLPEQTFLQI